MRKPPISCTVSYSLILIVLLPHSTVLFIFWKKLRVTWYENFLGGFCLSVLSFVYLSKTLAPDWTKKQSRSLLYHFYFHSFHYCLAKPTNKYPAHIWVTVSRCLGYRQYNGRNRFPNTAVACKTLLNNSQWRCLTKLLNTILQAKAEFLSV